MQIIRQLNIVALVGLALTTELLAATPPAPECFLAKKGRPEAVIVIGKDSGAFYRWVAGEVQRYVRELSGAELPIVTAGAIPPRRPLIVLGGPKSNPLAARAEQTQLVHFAGLKRDGFVLKTVQLQGTPALVVGGNDEASTMYAAYELLERLGVVFQLSGDIIPQKKPDLAFPSLDARIEPALKYRGMANCHALRWHMGLDDFRKHIDQLAKLKMNLLHFYWGIGGSPWMKFSHGGKEAEIFYPKESGYLAFGGLPGACITSGTADDIRVGRECFPNKYLGPPEFAGVQSPDQAFATAQDFLREIIRYAHSRKVQVWLVMGEIPRVPPSLVPPAKEMPDGWTAGNVFYCGPALPVDHPALLNIWEAAVRTMIETYPEADGYGVFLSEHSRVSTNKHLTDEYAAARKLLPSVEDIIEGGMDDTYPKTPETLESDFVDMCVAAKLAHRIKAKYPNEKFGVSVLFRGYLLRAFDAMLPKDVWLMNMENYANTKSVMHFYDGIQGRELLAMPRIVDDGCNLHMQLNVSLYERDEIIPGAACYGLAGVVGQLNKERGLECNARFIADGAWAPQINCRSFYQGYLPRVFGPAASDTLLKAYELLEENEKILGWDGRDLIFIGYDRFSPVRRVPLRTSALQEAQPKLTSQKLEDEIKLAIQLQQRWADLATRYRRALPLLRQAKPQVLPGARAELDYVIFKTNTFAGYLDVMAAGYEAVAACNRAVLAKTSGDNAEMQKQLERSQAAIDRADRLAREVARQMIPYADITTERYLLFRFNQNVIGWTETSRAALAKVRACYPKKG